VGRGSGTTQQGVKKPKTIHIIGDGGGVSSFGGGASSSETSSNICLFSLDLKIKYAAGGSPRATRGDTVTLARISADEVGVFVSNRRLSSYTGKQKERLLECMARGYVYSGQVQSVGANTLRAIVKGGVLGHEAPSAA
jgi:hypothetical protein